MRSFWNFSSCVCLCVGEGELYWGDVLINCRWGISFSLIESTKNLHIQGIISIFFKKKSLCKRCLYIWYINLSSCQHILISTYIFIFHHSWVMEIISCKIYGWVRKQCRYACFYKQLLWRTPWLGCFQKNLFPKHL